MKGIAIFKIKNMERIGSFQNVMYLIFKYQSFDFIEKNVEEI